MSSRILSLVTLLASASASVAAAVAQPSAEQLDFFEKRIRPILVENCYKCHSVEQGKSKGDLTLDTRDALLKGGKNGTALEPGVPEKSLLITAINYLDPDLQMPPKGEKLTAAQIADLTEWVKMGAPDPRLQVKAIGSGKLTGLTDKSRHHWAYQPIKVPAVPTVKNAAWSKSPIDNFILQKLEEKKMAPAPDADKEALLRRASYDLIGLPPTPQEVEAFLADRTPTAFAKVVDRLLASPHYGERWGRFWLDTARYSDTAGGEKNANILKAQDYRYAYAWTYRDYVIKSFNEDKPYDEFILEQVAADKLPATETDKTKLAALGFLTVGERFRNVNDVINDRIDVVSKGFLGLTVSCARCHDHMFDPIPTKDYYALHGIFASTFEPVEKPLINTPSADQLADFQQKLAKVEQDNRDTYYKFLGKVLPEIQNNMASYLLVARYNAKKGGGTEEEQKARIKLFQEAKLNRYLTPVMFRATRVEDSIYGPFRAFAALSAADFVTKAPDLAATIAANANGKKHVNPLVAAAFKDVTITSIEDVANIYGKLFASLEPQRKALLEAASKTTSETTVSGFAPDLIALLQSPMEIMPASRLDTQTLRAFVQKIPQQILRGIVFPFARLNEIEMTHPGAPARAMLVSDTPKIKDSPVFIRGQAETKGEVVPRRFLEILSNGKAEPFKEGSGRLELAQAIASKSNPLTARVIVNRIWLHHFGEGFVPTPDDLGTQSEPPSHPELLDYLAHNFMENGWSFKKLHRSIMLSRVYQQSSRTVPEYEVMDPTNRLLWRANIRRLDFEATRDSLLVFAGTLDPTLGGKPINLTDEPYSNRRSVYGYIDRGNLPDIMANFDFSDPDMPNSKRNTTIVPQQALFLMNSAMSIDVARHVAARPEVLNARDNLSRVFAMYRVLFQRAPRPDEIKLALDFVGREITSQPALEELANSADGIKKQKQQQNKLANRAKNGKRAATNAIQNEGEIVERKPLTPWETFAQALVLSNEAAYVN